MELRYKGKKTIGAILESRAGSKLNPAPRDATSNWLIQGDNLAAMAAMLGDEGPGRPVDLVYIDPPYSTNTVFRQGDDRTATVSAALDSDVAYKDTLQGPQFLEFIRERLVFLRELMAPHSSIFLHIDYKIGHYVKVIMDEIFGETNFRNDVARVKCNPKNFARKGFGNIKDLILFYSKSSDFTWHEPKVHVTEADIARLFPKVDLKGRRYTTTPLHAPGETTNGNTGREWRGMRPPDGRHWRCDPSTLEELDKQGLIEWSSTGNPRKIIFADDAELKGKKLQDIWEFKDHPYPSYPTEKNIELVRTIISACSNPGDTILDCFCGSGTSLIAAHELSRRWIGVDASEVAIKTTRARLGEVVGALFEDQSYEFMTVCATADTTEATAPHVVAKSEKDG